MFWGPINTTPLMINAEILHGVMLKKFSMGVGASIAYLPSITKGEIKDGEQIILKAIQGIDPHSVCALPDTSNGETIDGAASANIGPSGLMILEASNDGSTRQFVRLQ